MEQNDLPQHKITSLNSQTLYKGQKACSQVFVEFSLYQKSFNESRFEQKKQLLVLSDVQVVFFLFNVFLVLPVLLVGRFSCFTIRLHSQINNYK